MLFPTMIFAIENPSERNFMIALYRDNYDIMYAVGYRILHDRSLVEDAISTACEKLICKVSMLMGYDSYTLRSYIVSTVRNTAINMANKIAREQKRSKYIDEDEAEDTLPAQDDVEYTVLRQEVIQGVADALECLQERDRDLLRMRYYDDMTDAEIALVVDIGAASVRTCIMRARKRLLCIIRERGLGL